HAILHGHCHQKSLMGMQTTQELLAAMGVNAELLDSGCCGMAGSFGFERGHYDVSLKVAEHMLLPRVRSTPQRSLIIADGFSLPGEWEPASRKLDRWEKITAGQREHRWCRYSRRRRAQRLQSSPVTEAGTNFRMRELFGSGLLRSTPAIETCGIPIANAIRV